MRDPCKVNGWKKGLMKVSFGGLVILKKCRILGLLKVKRGLVYGKSPIGATEEEDGWIKLITAYLQNI